MKLVKGNSYTYLENPVQIAAFKNSGWVEEVEEAKVKTLAEMTVKELQEIATSKQINLPNKATKAEIIALIEKADAGE